MIVCIKARYSQLFFWISLHPLLILSVNNELIKVLTTLPCATFADMYLVTFKVYDSLSYTSLKT